MLQSEEHTKMGRVRVGLVGMGIGKLMAKGLAATPRGEMVALCDILPERMDAVAAELPAPVKYYTDYREMCRDPEVDAVFVVTPNQWHVPVALEAIRNDKHVLVTKPLADALVPAEELVAAAEASGVVNMMSLTMRFDPATQYLGQMNAAGGFGPIYYGHARVIRRSGIPSWSLGFIQKGGGVFRDLGVHLLDAAWWIMGMPEPVSVLGTAGARFGPRGVGYWQFAPQPAEIAQQFAADDYGAGLFRFANGAALHVETFWASHQPEEIQVEIFGEEAGAKLRPLTIYRTVDDQPVDETIEVEKEPTVWERIAAHFV
jgi:predicted dehydrogenase